jgi:hypothetical protein
MIYWKTGLTFMRCSGLEVTSSSRSGEDIGSRLCDGRESNTIPVPVRESLRIHD